MSKKPPRKGNQLDIYRYTGMAVKMAVVILIGVWGGQKIDSTLQNGIPWVTVVLSLISIAVAIYIVIRDTRN